MSVARENTDRRLTDDLLEDVMNAMSDTTVGRTHVLGHPDLRELAEAACPVVLRHVDGEALAIEANRPQPPSVPITAGIILRRVIAPTLRMLDLPGDIVTPAALLLGTAAHESGGFRYLRQLGGGPALSWWQIEPATHTDVWNNFLAFRASIREKVEMSKGVVSGVTLQLRGIEMADIGADDRRLLTHPIYACAIARLVYFRRPAPLPRWRPGDDPAPLASYWKTHFNTWMGKGTPEHFERAWQHHNLGPIVADWAAE